MVGEGAKMNNFNNTLFLKNKLKVPFLVLLLLWCLQACGYIKPSEWNLVFSSPYLRLIDLRQSDGNFVVAEHGASKLLFFQTNKETITEPITIELPPLWMIHRVCLSDNIWVLDINNRIAYYEFSTSNWNVQEELLDLKLKGCETGQNGKVIFWGDRWVLEWNGHQYTEPQFMNNGIITVGSADSSGGLIILKKNGEIYRSSKNAVTFLGTVSADYSYLLKVISEPTETVWIGAVNKLFRWTANQPSPELMIELDNYVQNDLEYFLNVSQDNENNVLIVATNKIYMYSDTEIPISINLPSNIGEVNGAMLDQARGRLYLVTQKGIFYSSIEQLHKDK